MELLMELPIELRTARSMPVGTVARSLFLGARSIPSTPDI